MSDLKSKYYCSSRGKSIHNHSLNKTDKNLLLKSKLQKTKKNLSSS